jgi:hypothetical protein
MDARSTVKALDGVIASLQRLRSGLVAESAPESRASELQGRYINAPVWPWFAAGWIVGALFVLLFLIAWTWGGT